MFKKVYVEITNNCNLRCKFCTLNKREQKFISIDDFKKILNSLKGYTNYLYFHVLGEPLLHPNINDLINLASENFNINITTNGYLINRIKDNKNIRQINISLHSFIGNNDELNNYMNNVFDVCDELSKNTYISYRLWANTEYYNDIITILEKKYNTKIVENTTTLANNIYISDGKEFIWPSLDSEIISDKGMCYALRDHIGILVDGTVIPCCLDGDGIINLGNIFNEGLSSIIDSDRYQLMLNGFKNNHKCEELCKRCNFINK